MKQNTHADSQLIMEVVYFAGSAANWTECSGSFLKMCCAMTAATSFLFLPDGLSPEGGRVDEDEYQS